MEAFLIQPVYADIWALTELMLDSARRSDWDNLIELEHQRSALVEQLQNREETTLSVKDPGLIKEQIENIQAADMEIKSLTKSWMNELQGVLNSIDTEKKLHKAYETS